MVESGRQNLHLPLGEDLVVGHVHARAPADTEGSSHSPRIKRRIRAKTSLADLERRERGDPGFPNPLDSGYSEGIQQRFRYLRIRLPQQFPRQAARKGQSALQLEVRRLI